MTTKFSHYEWMRPSGYWEGDGKPYYGFVAIQTTAGWLVMVRVNIVVETGEITRELAKAADLGYAPHPQW